ncbi:MAG: hypothetical protein PUB53_02825 [Bacteroidales bacterium]|nr:hypothetical protein [Bacteroidales bacterium]
MVFMIGLVGVECAEGHKVYCKSKAWYVADKEKNIIFFSGYQDLGLAQSADCQMRLVILTGRK